MITFHAIPRAKDARGKEDAPTLGMYGSHGVWVTDEQGIRSALNGKGSAYGKLEAPFVVAVAASNDLSSGNHDVRNALYGTEAVQLGVTADGREVQRTIRRPDGIWQAGRTEWDHRRCRQC